MTRVSIKLRFGFGREGSIFLIYWDGELVHRCKRSTDAIRIAQALDELDEATQRPNPETIQI